jgi:hypothetical protein
MRELIIWTGISIFSTNINVEYVSLKNTLIIEKLSITFSVPSSTLFDRSESMFFCSSTEVFKI